MKQYQKPALYALSLSANDALCAWGTCSAKTRFDDALNSWLIIMFGDDDKDGLFEPSDGGNAFAAADHCSEEVVYENYCKFTAADSGLTQLFTS